MVRHNLEYPRDAHNTVNRYNHQADYSLTTIHTIINTSPVLHVSFHASPTSPFPTILPMIGHMGSFTHPSASLSSPLDIYLHGYVSSRLMNLSRSASSSTTSPSSPDPPGLPVCVAATKVDGLVLTLTPYSHNYNYRSAVLFGHATPVTDAEEKLFAMELLTNDVVPDRWAQTRVPPTSAEMSATQILKVVVQGGSAKVREGGPSDERGDAGDGELVERVWTGVVPVYEVLGEPVPGGYNKVEKVPTHVAEWRERENEERRGYAGEAARKDAPVPVKKRDDEEV